MFDPPLRKKDVYVSRIKTKRGKPIRIQCANTRFIGMQSLDDDQGYIIKVGFSKDSLALEQVSTWDRAAFQQTMEHFSDWFPNSEMTDEQLRQYFRPSVTPPSLMTVIASNIQEPILVQLDDMEVSMHHLFELERDVLRGFYCQIELEAQGLYFHPKKYGIRWMIRKIIFTRKKLHSENEQDILPNNKDDIETQWHNDIQETFQQIQQDISQHEQRIVELREAMVSIQKSLEIAKTCSSMDKTWNDALEQVRYEMAKYQRHPN